MTLKIAARSTRAGEIVSAPAEDSREVEISFSSEAPVLRAFWDEDAEDVRHYHEVLGHAPGEVDLARLNTGAAPLLKDHEARIDSQIGVVVRAWTAEGRGRAVVRFSTNAAADDVLARVRAGDVTCVSVGYGITQAEKDGTAEDGRPIVRAVNWAPREISFVAIPADPSVGYGRAAQSDVETLSINESADMPDPIPTPEDTHNDPTPAPAPVPAQPKGPGQDLQRAMRDERARIATIDAMAERFNVPADVARAAKKDGVSVDAFREIVLDKLDSERGEATRAKATEIGLTQRETKSFSVVRLLRHLSNPDERRFEQDAGFEIEAVRAANGQHKGQVRGVILPTEVMRDRPSNPASQVHAIRAADQFAGTPSLGGNIVDETLMAGSMIDILRNMSVLPRLGARVFSGLVGDVAFPKQLTDVTAYWIPEDGSPAKSAITFGQVKMTPHTVAAMNEISRRLLIQDAVSVEAYVRASIMAQIALKIDNAGLNADADPDAPAGLGAVFAQGGSGIHHVDLAAAGQPTYVETVKLRTAVKKANALQGSLGYALSPDVEEHLLTTPKFGAGAEVPIMVEEGRLGGYSAACSNQVEDADLWFGNWSDFYMGLWSGVDLLVDPYSNSGSGAVRIVAHQDVDFAIAREQSFALGRRTSA
ncbi:phage major capsid protein [Roseobacter weihaiensis]|uniref:phage major capsid protein n=1 Tax=Roseobacter weihaiensis TaxID=2763262 RepID=UPI001D0B3422|nr:phage major capsid protein [Roseobacter sp. H9]